MAKILKTRAKGSLAVGTLRLYSAVAGRDDDTFEFSVDYTAANGLPTEMGVQLNRAEAVRARDFLNAQLGFVANKVTSV